MKKNRYLEKLIIPGTETTEKGTLYEGWRGGNCGKWRDEKELKALILADLKKCGIKATLKFRPGGYLIAFTLTLTITADHIKTFEEYKKDGFKIDFYGWNIYTTEAGKIDYIMGDAVDMNNAELLDNIAKTRYKMEVENLTGNTYHRNNAEILNDAGNEILEATTAILNSYNSDNSNGQIDYFDRAFYDHITFKIK